MPPELPRGLTPYACSLELSPGEFAEKIRSEGFEVGAAFNLLGAMVARPRQGSADNVRFDDGEVLEDAIVVHNHSLGGAPSPKDAIFAVEWNLRGLRMCREMESSFHSSDLKKVGQRQILWKRL